MEIENVRKHWLRSWGVNLVLAWVIYLYMFYHMSFGKQRLGDAFVDKLKDQSMDLVLTMLIGIFFALLTYWLVYHKRKRGYLTFLIICQCVSIPQVLLAFKNVQSAKSALAELGENAAAVSFQTGLQVLMVMSLVTTVIWMYYSFVLRQAYTAEKEVIETNGANESS